MVKPIKDTINVRVTNNTSLNQNVNLLGGTSDPLAIPPSLLYQWDLSSESYFGSVTATIVISTTLNPTPITYTVQVNGYNIQSVVFALNTLNLGVFQYSGNIIYTSSDYYIYGALQVGSTVFTSVWDTTNTSGGSSASNQIQLPLDPFGSYDFVVDWGDGNQDTITSWNQAETLHTYSSSGVYTISIFGVFKGVYFNNTGDRLKILSISNWGSFELIGNSGNQFYGCLNLDLTAVYDVLNFGNCTNCSSMFRGYSYSTINNIGLWDVSNVTDMSFMFASTSFNQSLNTWNVGNVTNMLGLFSNSQNFNQPLNSWNTSSVTNTRLMFNQAINFNQSLSNWDVSNVANMSAMFSFATNFNQPLNTWNVGNVTDMSGTFSFVTNFNQPLNNWNVSSVTNMNSMFASAPAFNQSLNSWNVSNVTNMSGMFRFASSFNQPLNNWNISSVTDISSMFRSATNFNQNINSWNTSLVANMANLFNTASSFNQPLNSWNVSSVTNMQSVFQNTSFNQDISSWDVSSVTNMTSMFQNSLFDQNIGTWDVSNVLTMFQMFQNNNSFNQNIGSWNISNVSIFDNFMSGKTPATFSTTNLDAIYNGWSLLLVQPSLSISFGTAKYTLAGQAGRNTLTGAPNNWNISDGGI